MQTGGRLVIKPTRKQIDGGFLSALASIGIPIAIELVSKMFGKGLQVDKTPPPTPAQSLFQCLSSTIWRAISNVSTTI